MWRRQVIKWIYLFFLESESFVVKSVQQDKQASLRTDSHLFQPLLFFHFLFAMDSVTVWLLHWIYIYFTIFRLLIHNSFAWYISGMHKHIRKSWRFSCPMILYHIIFPTIVSIRYDILCCECVQCACSECVFLSLVRQSMGKHSN